MEISELIRTRRSIRKFDSRPIEEEKLNRIMEAGRLAPSASNKQDWKFILVTDKTILTNLAEACNGQSFVAEAPAAIISCSNSDRVMSCGQSAATVDCSIAMSFMIMQATDLGLGTCWLGSFNQDAVKKAVEISDDYTVVAITPLGYPTEIPASRPRKAVSQVWIRK